MAIECTCEFPRRSIAINPFLGKRVVINLCCLARVVEEQFGLAGIMEVTDLPAEECADWAKVEEAKERSSQEEVARWDKAERELGAEQAQYLLGNRPQPYEKKEPPGWLAARVGWERPKEWRRNSER